MILGLGIILPVNIMYLESPQSCEVAGSRGCINGLAACVRRSLYFPFFLHAAEPSRGKYRLFCQSPTSELKEKVLFRIIWIIAPSIIFAGFSYSWC